jgi:phage repressor protein C with HTH and peptisase S24 domain
MAAVEESQLYRDLMRFKPDELTANGWAVKAGVSRSVWADMRRHGNPSRRTLAKLLAVAGSSLAEFEALQIGEKPQPIAATSAAAGVSDARGPKWSPAPAVPVPVPLYATAMAGEYATAGDQVELTEIDTDSVVEKLGRPDTLVADRDAYAVTIVGDSMWPRFRPGRRVMVSPRAPVAIGDDVVVHLRSEDRAEGGVVRILIKELLRRTPGFVELRQFNPDASFRVKTDEIATIHKVVGEVY